MSEDPYGNLLFDHVDGFESFVVLWGQSLSCFPLLCKGAAVIDPQPAYVLAESAGCAESIDSLMAR